MDLYDAINARRSIRSFKPDAVHRDVLKRIVQAGIEAPTGCNMQLRQFVIVDEPHVVAKLAEHGVMKGAPACVVILMNPQETAYGAFWVQDASATMENMLLAAVAEGLGACWVEGNVTPKEDDLRKILSVPKNLRIWSVMAVGVPDSEPVRPPKPEFKDIVHINRFGSGV